MRLLVGLGNPGPRHAQNRHNIGFMAVDEIALRYGLGPWRRRFEGRLAEGQVAGHRVLALKPETYMNESGASVSGALRFYKLEPSQVIVFYDEIDLAPAKMKVKLGGGAAGHNGIRSLISHLGANFWRVRLGVGHPGHKDQVHGWVLRDFPKADRKWVDKLTDAVARELPLLLDGDDGAFMSRVAFLLAPPKPKREPPEDDGITRTRGEGEDGDGF